MALELVLTSFVCVAYREASPTSSPHHYHYHHRRPDEGHHSRRSLHSLPFVAAVSKALTSALFLPIYGLYLLQSCNFSQALATAIVAKAFDADGYGMRDDSQLTYFYLDLLAALFGAILAAALCRALTWLRAADTATNR